MYSDGRSQTVANRPLADINDQAPRCSYKLNLARRGIS